MLLQAGAVLNQPIPGFARKCLLTFLRDMATSRIQNRGEQMVRTRFPIGVALTFVVAATVPAFAQETKDPPATVVLRVEGMT